MLVDNRGGGDVVSGSWSKLIFSSISLQMLSEFILSVVVKGSNGILE